MTEETEKYSFKESIDKEIKEYISMKKALILQYPFVGRDYSVKCGVPGDGFRIRTSIDDLDSDQQKIHYKGRVIDARIKALEDILKWTCILGD